MWLAGSGLLLVRFVAARVLLLAAGRRWRRVVDDALRGPAERIRHRLGWRRRVRLAEVMMKNGHGLCHDTAGNGHFAFEPETIGYWKRLAS